jgi:hypothetical protein
MRIALVVPGCQVWHLLQLWDILVETEIGAAGSPSHRLSPLRDGFGRLLSSVVGSLVLLLPACVLAACFPVHSVASVGTYFVVLILHH